MVQAEAKNDVTMCHIRIECWISKATRMHTATPPVTYINTHTDKYVIRIAFPRQQSFRESASLLCYTYIVCLVIFKHCKTAVNAFAEMAAVELRTHALLFLGFYSGTFELFVDMTLRH